METFDFIDELDWQAIRTAGAHARSIQTTALAWCKSDGTLVTPADQEVEQRLREVLGKKASFVGEEDLADQTTPQALSLKGRCYVVDPIDGTALYTLGMPGWGVSVGLLENGQLSNGLVYFPMSEHSADGFVISSQKGTVLRAMVDHGRPKLSDLEWQPIPTIATISGYPGMVAVTQTVCKHAIYKGHHTLMNTASCVFSFYHLMRRAFCGYYSRVKLWDLAAVWPLAHKLGIKACDAQGREMDLSIGADFWQLDPKKEWFLGQHEQILYYHPDLMNPQEFLADVHWKHS